MSLTPLHIHLILSHFPIVGNVIGFAILCYGIWARKHLAVQIALVLFVVNAVLCIPVYLSGEGAGTVIRAAYGTSQSHISLHERWGLALLLNLGFIGVISLGMLAFSFKSETPRLFRMGRWLALICVLAIGMSYYTGEVGRQIRRDELRTPPRYTQLLLGDFIIRKG